MTLSDWANVATVSGAVAGVMALLYTAGQIRQNTRVHRAEFWLTLRQMFADHAEISLKLRPGKWPNDDRTAPDESDIAKLEAYMGLLEHCEIMLADGLLDWPTFRDIYQYRIDLILNNPLIVRDLLIRGRDGWQRFLNLVRRSGAGSPPHHPEHEPDMRPAALKPVASRRYLCGYYDIEKRCWTLWWGRVGHERKGGRGAPWRSAGCLEGASDFGSRAEMEAAYHERMALERASPRPVHFAWLIGDRHEVLDRFPEPVRPGGSPMARLVQGDSGSRGEATC